MRVVVLANARSGLGLARRAAARCAGALRGAGHEVVEVAVGNGAEKIGDVLRGAGLLVLAGGDGTVHRMARGASEARVPVYHLPCGNENLFAREFGMTRSAGQLVGAAGRRRVVEVDVGEVKADGRGQTAEEMDGGGGAWLPFVLMCGVGPDASVIRRLTELRTKAIGHLAYVEPVIREALSPCFPRLTVEVDGERVVDERRGMLVVANCRQYALRIDPAERARMDDGVLDAVFMPCRSAVGAVWWGARARMRRLARHPQAVYRTGREITVRMAEPAPYQVDGDAPDWQGAGVEREGGATPGARELNIRMAAMKLPVLVP